MSNEAKIVGAPFDGRFVLEHDVSIDGVPPEERSGPVDDVRVSQEFLRSCPDQRPFTAEAGRR